MLFRPGRAIQVPFGWQAMPSTPPQATQPYIACRSRLFRSCLVRWWLHDRVLLPEQLASSHRRRPRDSLVAFNIWLSNFAWLSVNYFSGASVVHRIVTCSSTWTSALAVIVPLLVVSYLTFRTAMGRGGKLQPLIAVESPVSFEQSRRSPAAIDAKDRSHGHIRRVQAYAVSQTTRRRHR